MEQIKTKISLNSFQLKWIAIITMAIDHTGAILFPSLPVFRYIGRIAFPIFCYLLVEGFFHTRDIQRYMGRLFVFAVVSEIPYDLAFRGVTLEFGHQNVFFTLFFGVFMMYAFEKASSLPVKTVEALFIMWLTAVLGTDYSYKGILLIGVFYVLREKFWIKMAAGALWNFTLNSSIQRFGAFAMIPIALYNGERGRSMKYFFYLFYPLHLLILYGASRWLMQICM